MMQIWVDATKGCDLMLTNEDGEDYNMSLAVRIMNRKIEDSIGRANDVLLSPVRYEL